MMRDIVRHYQAEGPEPVKAILADPAHPARRDYLQRFADMEGRVFIDRFHRRYRDRSPDEALALLASRARPVPHRLATVYHSARPDADYADFRAFMIKHLREANSTKATCLSSTTPTARTSSTSTIAAISPVCILWSCG